jgi:hypothetical protein
MQNGNPNNTQIQPYKSWKGSSKSLAVPGKKRPSSNNDPSSISNDGLDPNAFRARPIKHWRKQLHITENEGTSVKTVIYDNTPSSTVAIDGSCCDASSYKIISNISSLKNNNFYENCCNPEIHIIKPSTTILNPKYYTDSRAYLKSRCKLYDQKLSGTPYDGVTYFDENGVIILPTDDILNTSLRSMTNCSQYCSTIQKTIYKPSNAKYATQGAVSSSSRITRLKLDTVNSNASSFRSALGAAASNAGKYRGSMSAPYFIKSKIQACDNTHR